MTNDQRSGGKRDGRIALRARSHTRKSLAVILVAPAIAMELWLGPILPSLQNAEANSCVRQHGLPLAGGASALTGC